MPFAHEDADFDDLLRIVAERRRLALGLVEKDYWVTHTLWALHAQGFDVWFKGGTSLSKGFGLIERFSEDLDLKIEPGQVAALPLVTNWRSEGRNATTARRTYFERLRQLLDVPHATIALEAQEADATWRGANLRVLYPGRHLGDLEGVLRPFVLLEVGSARVAPAVERSLSSFVHQHLMDAGQLGDFADNRPAAVRCVHPLVTLVEKLDALHRRVGNPVIEPASFVRHFEDAARVIAGQGALPPLAEYPTVRALAEDMLGQRQVATVPEADDPAFAPDDGERWVAIRRGYDAIAPMYWGPRIPLEDACATIRAWISASLHA
jgi:hypothetical protein